MSVLRHFPFTHTTSLGMVASKFHGPPAENMQSDATIEKLSLESDLP